jgi:hypothetical protein
MTKDFICSFCRDFTSRTSRRINFEFESLTHLKTHLANGSVHKEHSYEEKTSFMRRSIRRPNGSSHEIPAVPPTPRTQPTREIDVSLLTLLLKRSLPDRKTFRVTNKLTFIPFLHFSFVLLSQHTNFILTKHPPHLLHSPCRKNTSALSAKA